MKNEPNKQNSPDPQSAHRRHILRIVGFALGLLILLTLFSLLVIGLPPQLTRRITREVQAAGIPLQIDSIRLSTHRGWVLQNAKLYSTSPDDLLPLLSAKKLYVMPWPVDWKNPAAGGWRIKLYVKNLGVSLGSPWESVLPANHPFRTVTRLQGSLTAAPGQVTIENARLSWGGVDILARGTARFAEAENKTSKESVADFRRRAAKAVDLLNQLKCEKPPQLDLSFYVDTARPEDAVLETSLSAEGLTVRDRVYQAFSGKASLSDNLLTITTLQLSRTNLEQLVLNGSVNFGNSNSTVHLANTMSASDLLNLLPDEAQSAVAQTGVKPYGRLDFTASVGPAPYDQLDKKIEVQIQQAHLKRQDITLDPIALHLLRDENQVTVTNMQARLNGGTVAGWFSMDMDSKNCTGNIQAQCDPGPVCALIDADLYEFVQRLHFPAEQPQVDLAVSYDATANLVTAVGTIAGDRFTCGGVPVGHFDTFMVYSNEVLDLAPLHVVRAKEQFDGNVQVRFVSGLGIFTATNSFPPVDIARALAPNDRTVLEDFRFSGPVYAEGSGQIDYRNWTNHAFKGTFRAEDIGYGKVSAELFTSDVEARGAQIFFTNAAARFYGGFAEGSADFDLLLEDGSAPYRVNARISQINLAKMLRKISSNDYERTRGELSATLNLSADAKSGFWASAQGGGTVKIENGRLADLPLFGGFSRLIQSAFSGFNLFSLTAFSADYQLHDGALWSENAQLGGTLISARGHGNYSPEKGLDFTIAAEPLRQTGDKNKEWYQVQRLAASATAPLFRLLEFQLTGPLEKPDWNFVNLSKDIPSLPKEAVSLPKDVSSLILHPKGK